MLELMAGLFIFFSIHLIPSFPDFRHRLMAWKGKGLYMIAYSASALSGLALLIHGKATAPHIAVFDAPDWATSVNAVLMWLAVILFLAAYLPTNLKRVVRHPFLSGVVLWAVAHLLVNGDLSSLLLFTSFALFALFDMWSFNRRGATLAKHHRPFWNDGILVMAGTAIYVAIIYLHPLLFGVAVNPF